MKKTEKYENLIFFYLNYDYDENINEFIEKLNEALKEIVDNKEIIDSSIEFKLLAKEDIIDKADGSKVYKKGQEIKKYNLTKDGKLTITSLPMGIYELVETKTLDGLVLDTTKYEVKLEQD